MVTCRRLSQLNRMLPGISRIRWYLLLRTNMLQALQSTTPEWRSGRHSGVLTASQFKHACGRTACTGSVRVR